MQAVTAGTQTNADGLLDNAFGYTKVQIRKVNELKSRNSDDLAKYLLQAVREHNRGNQR